MNDKLQSFIEYSDKVKNALKTGKPVVAIESAGTFEGFRYPENIEVAKMVTKAIEDKGAVAAYIGIVGGKIKVGFSESDMEYLSDNSKNFLKASRRDIPFILAKKGDAITAVAATMMIADAIGIKVVTGGGLGGVHRGATHTMDISADLCEFEKSEVIVVCSGAKSILDLGLTLEYLETHSVPIAGYKTKELPAYLSTRSGYRLDFSLESPEEAVSTYENMKMLGNRSGLLICNPVSEELSADYERMNSIIEGAVEEAEKIGIRGKNITKFIMERINAQMGGDSKEAAVYINRNNASLAAQIAVVLSLTTSIN